MTAKRFFLIGHPLGHSLSPEIHAAIMRASGVNGSYELLDTPPDRIPDTVPRLMRESDGFNATIPHKKAVMPFLSGLSDAARRCDAVNTVFQGRGYNTDTVGFASARLSLRGASVLLLGTGGVSAMMAAESVAAGAKTLIVASRSEASARAFVSSLHERFPETKCDLGSVDSSDRDRLASAVGAATVLLNGTPVGMWPRAGGIPVPPESLHAGLEVFDPVYCPTPTRLVLAARKVGARAVGGLPMLVHQAVAAQKIWNPGLDLDAGAIAANLVPGLVADLWRKNPTKVMLTGFMGAGKSTVGRLLAEKLGIGFVDLDAAIVQSAGVPISKIFETSGEEGFRNLETETARRILAEGPSAVVASGGGFPTFEHNRELVRVNNALVLNVDVDFETAWQRIADDGSRPLSRSREETATLFYAREPVYRSFCDASVRTSADKPASSVAERASALLRAEP